jgi:hypothetical protein
MFQTYAPLLWPLYGRSIEIVTSLELHLGGTQLLVPSAAVMSEPTIFTSFQTFDAPLIAVQGTGLTIVLLTPFIVQSVVNLKRGKATSGAHTLKFLSEAELDSVRDAIERQLLHEKLPSSRAVGRFGDLRSDRTD